MDMLHLSARAPRLFCPVLSPNSSLASPYLPISKDYFPTAFQVHNFCHPFTPFLRYGAGSQVAVEQAKLAQLHAFVLASHPDEHTREDHGNKMRDNAREAESVLKWFGRTYESALHLAEQILADGGKGCE
jgi:hypothetical protein